ncbi:MAG: tetratricopeptide repeat protein [Vicingaceae bacterium]
MVSAFKKYGLLFIFLLSLIAFFPGLNNEFTHLDDQVQVVENSTIQKLDWTNIRAIFSSTSVGMYQPLSSLLYAITYQFNGADAFNFHLLSLLFHFFNIFLIYSLLQKLNIDKINALLLTAVFALHPMQVESVSWVSAFSNLTYSCFYLAALIKYRDFQRNNRGRQFALTLLFFILALLSKSTAVTLPLLLLASDYFEDHKIKSKNWLNKLPFFALSIGFGLITIFSRESAGHLSDLSVQFDWFDRIFLVSYSVLFYPFKWIFPFELSAFYPYPELSNGLLPWIYYASTVALIVAFWLIWKHRKRTYLLFGALIYLLSISVVLQIIPVGNQLTTDRYIYLPMLGLLIMIYELIRSIQIRKLLPLFGIWTLLLLLASHQRTKVWTNDQLIWEDVIEKHPNVAQAYNNLGSYLLQKGQAQKAFNHFNKAVQLKPYYADALSNRGNLYSQQGKTQKALNDFNQAIKLRPHADAYFNRANEYVRLGKLRKAIKDYIASTELNASPDTYTNWAYALLQLKQTKEAEDKLQKALQLNPQFAQAHFLSGMLAQQQNKINQACTHFQKAAQQNHAQGRQALERFCK